MIEEFFCDPCIPEYSSNKYIIILGVLGNAPKMLWTSCPNKYSCDRCLDVTFEIGKDTACLKQKWSDNPCVFEGTFLASGTRLAVSSEECLMVGYLDNIQVMALLTCSFI